MEKVHILTQSSVAKILISIIVVLVVCDSIIKNIQWNIIQTLIVWGVIPIYKERR